jgi:N-acetylmuramoyl-L-alanine amidase
MSVALLFLLLQPAPAETLRVRGERDVAVPVQAVGEVSMVRADLVAEALGGRVRTAGEGRFAIEIPGASLEVVDGVPFAVSGAVVHPLAGAPRVDASRLLVPLHLVSEVFPRVGSGLIYDAARGELRVFNAVARRTSPPATPAVTRAPKSPRREEVAPAATARATSTASRPAPRPTRRRLVVIDAGHGGPDHGMSGPIGARDKIHEKDVTLAVARLVAVELRSLGYETEMTRTRDTLIALADRGRIANRLQGDLFLSIHVNAANLRWKNPGAARGFETYFLSEAKTEEESRVERMENEAVRFETGADAPKGDPLSFIINDMAQNEHLRESSDLAATIQGAMAGIHPGPNRGVKQANFAVLRTSFMPAVLIEIGFGTNAEEARFIAGAAGQRQLARSIAKGVVEYMSHYERRVGVTP